MIISPQATDSRGVTQPTGSMKTLGKDDFMKLFVTKLQNQNPLEPLPDDAFVAQLAQFSSLEQMQNMNENLAANLKWNSLNNQTINNSVAAQLIGSDVTAELSSLTLTESNTPHIGLELPKFAKELTVTIIDQSGNVVQTLRYTDVAPGAKNIDWDGKGSDGKRLAPGTYEMSINATDAEDAAFDVSAALTGRVDGVIYRNGAAFLQVNGMDIALGDIRKITRA